MNILFLNYEFPPLGGGGGTVSFEIAKRYVALGHTVQVVTMGWNELPAQEVVSGVHIHRVWSLRRKKELSTVIEMASYIISAIWFLSHHLRTYQYDVAHVHFIIPTGIVALWTQWIWKIPYIVTAHGSDVPGYNEDRFVFLHKILKPVILLVIYNAKMLTVPSDYLQGLINKNIGTKAVRVIYNGIADTAKVISEKKKIILATGRFLPRKGFQYLIEAVVPKDIGYEVHICGDGPQSEYLKSLAVQSKTKIVFHGWLDNRGEEYRILLQTAAIFCLPSSRENASMSILEALHAGCAVITSNESGCKEMVSDAGILVPIADAAAIRNALEKLIKNSQLLQQYQERARVRAQEFLWPNIIRQYEAQLRAITNHHDQA